MKLTEYQIKAIEEIKNRKEPIRIKFETKNNEESFVKDMKKKTKNRYER